MSGNMESKNESSMKTFELSEKVTVEKVSYKTRYGITVVADMYLSKDMDESKKYPAIVIGTPYGGVKEQGAGIYAQNLAERGFVAIASMNLLMAKAVVNQDMSLPRIYLLKILARE